MKASWDKGQTKFWLDQQYVDLIEKIFELQEEVEAGGMSVLRVIETKANIVALQAKARYIDELRNEYISKGKIE